MMCNIMWGIIAVMRMSLLAAAITRIVKSVIKNTAAAGVSLSCPCISFSCSPIKFVDFVVLYYFVLISLNVL